MVSIRVSQWAVVATTTLGLPAWSQENPYTYVKMSLLVPWTLYFVFLACVLIPFVLAILLAWRRNPDRRREDASTSPVIPRTNVDAAGE